MAQGENPALKYMMKEEKMYKVTEKKRLADKVYEYEIEAPAITRNARPGQFVIVISQEGGERLPFTIAGIDKERGRVKIIVQTVGLGTLKLEKAADKGEIFAIAGPLGKPTDLSGYENIVLVAGGIGAAVIYPQAVSRKREGKPAEVILGARNESLLLYEKEFEENARRLTIMTDDGSKGEKGFVTDALEKRLKEGGVDAVFAVGPLIMMKFVCAVAKKYGVKCIISMNTLMVDGTGMCGGCRLTYFGKTVYACVDGPEFDGEGVDFDEAAARGSTYREFEHECMLRYKGE